MAKPPAETAPGAPEPEAERHAAVFPVSLPPARPGEPPFEGPLDLLLHLVREHRVDIFDIPIARITEGYLAALQAMRQLEIDPAAEFLAMAAQLVLMKSKMLLPRTEVAEDAGAAEPAADPREELVRRLLEYQKYKAAAGELGRRDVLDRDVFARRVQAARPPPPEGPEGLAEISIFQLVEALDRALRSARPEARHEVVADRLSVSDAIARVAEVLRARGRVPLDELLGGPARRGDRGAVVATFLAVLEMARLRLVRLVEEERGPGGGVSVEARETLGEGAPGAGTEVDYR